MLYKNITIGKSGIFQTKAAHSLPQDPALSNYTPSKSKYQLSPSTFQREARGKICGTKMFNHQVAFESVKKICKRQQKIRWKI